MLVTSTEMMYPAYMCIENAHHGPRAAGLVVELADKLPPPDPGKPPVTSYCYPTPAVPGTATS